MPALLRTKILIIHHLLTQFSLKHQRMLNQLLPIVTLLTLLPSFALHFDTVAHCRFIIPPVDAEDRSATSVLLVTLMKADGRLIGIHLFLHSEVEEVFQVFFFFVDVAHVDCHFESGHFRCECVSE